MGVMSMAVVVVDVVVLVVVGSSITVRWMAL